MKTSPTSPYLYYPNATSDQDMVLRTQPFYSMFYYTADPDYTNITLTDSPLNKTPQGANCSEVLRGRTVQRAFYNKLPFSFLFSSGVGAANLYFLLVVLVATIVLGVIAFSYWSYLLDDDILDDAFRDTVMRRSAYLSVLFVVMTVILSVMLYELITLKLSLRWFQSDQPGPVYGFLRARKLVLWVILMLGVGLTLFTTAILARRPGQFKEQIVFNTVAIMVLFIAQYLYYQNPTSRIIKTFSLFLSVVIIGLVLFLMNAP